jgi:hypothetical protein
MQQKTDFMDAKTDEFQCAADFFSKWFELVGYGGATIYLHLLGLGHLRQYLKKWRNLNRFQKNGREVSNA